VALETSARAIRVTSRRQRHSVATNGLITERQSLYERLRQLVAEKRSGRLQVRHWDAKEGLIGLNDGRIVHCQYRRLRGLRALSVIRNWMSISLHFFENVENLTVDVEEDTTPILASLEVQHREMEKIRGIVPGAQAIFVLSSETPQGRVSVDQRLWKVLSMVNGRNSLKDICETLGAGEFSVSKVLAYLHQRGIIRVAAVERPMDPRLRDAFFEQLEQILTEYIGPIAPVIIYDTLEEMDKSADYLNRNDLSLLVERIGASLEDRDERVRFQEQMLALIQGIGKSEH
jgi:hypothetical protein